MLIKMIIDIYLNQIQVNKPLPMTGQSECIECPHTSCLCDIQWKFDKEKHEKY